MCISINIPQTPNLRIVAAMLKGVHVQLEPIISYIESLLVHLLTCLVSSNVLWLESQLQRDGMKEN